MNVAFFSYEGRGIRMGETPPRYETIDWDVYNTSTLENKVRDVLNALEVVRKQPGIIVRAYSSWVQAKGRCSRLKRQAEAAEKHTAKN